MPGKKSIRSRAQPPVVLQIGKKGRLMKQQRLLRDPKVLAWFKRLRLSSENTAEVYLRRLDYLCEELIDTKPFALGKDERLAPRHLVRKYGNRKGAKHFIQDLVTVLDEKGLTRDNIQNYVKVLKNWFAENDVEGIGKITFPTKRSHLGRSTVGRAASPDQLGEILAGATPRQRVPIALMAFSGFRPEVLGNSVGSDGLKVADFWEMKIEGGRVNFAKKPTLVVVRIESSKSRLEYLTFLNDEGIAILKEYLEARMGRGEKLNEESPILVPRNSVPEHITTNAVSNTVRVAFRNAKSGSRPYELRSYFETRMEMAEKDGVILKDWRKHFAGHVGDIDAKYTHDRGASSIPDYLIEDMRKTYKQAQSYLTTKQPKLMPKEQISTEINRVFLKLAKFTDDELEELAKKHGDLGKIKPEQIAQIVEEHQDSPSRGRQRGKYAANGNGKQFTVPADEVDKYLADGKCSYVATLPTNRVVLEEN